ncbi:hypothetical protein BC332_03457 [Capsicum chinense]|nr:hypothetical protein BC332_03457 [Capsicum chinense]
MGKKAKSSRKGKKAWRANISTEDIEDFLDNYTKDALSGGSLAQVPSDSLFYVDKSTDLSVKRKIEKHREKVLRCDSMLQSNAFVEPVPSSTGKKSKKKSKVQKAKDTAQQGEKDMAGGDFGMVDIWDAKGELVLKTNKKPKTSVIPAVEVEPPGCSFNPPSESHQDALACAVADEMQKIYRNELGPEPIPLIVPGEAVNEEDVSLSRYCLVSTFDHGPCRCIMGNVFYTPYEYALKTHLPQMYFLEADSGSDTENENRVEDGYTNLEKR